MSRSNMPPATSSSDDQARVFPGSDVLTGPLRESTAQRDEPHNVTLNLANASISQASKAVLSDILGRNYVIADGVKGTVTLQTARPVSKSELLGMFEIALQSQQLALTEQGSVYKIVPAHDIPPKQPSLASDGTDALLKIVELKYVAAREMEKILRPIAPKGAIVRVDETRNLLMLSGDPQSLVALHDAVAVFDVDWMAGMSFAIMPVSSADPTTVAKELQNVFSTDEVGALNGLVKFFPNTRLNAILVVSPRASYLSRVETWIKRLDLAANAAEEKICSYHIQNRPAGELVRVLQDMFQDRAHPTAARSPVAPRFTPVEVSSGPSGDNLSDVGGDSAPAFLPKSDLGNAKQDRNLTVAALETATTERNNPFGNVRVVADEPNNSLLIMATPRQCQRITGLLQHIDARPNQVLLEATIAEVSLNDELQFGLKWYFDQGKHNFSFSDLASGAVAPTFPGFSYFLSSLDVRVALKALAEITDVKIVSSPSLMVLDNRTAVLQVGDQVPVATQSAVSVLTPGAPIVNTVTFKDTGVILSVTPRVNENGNVLLDIQQEVSDVVKTTSSGIDSPTIQQRRIKTSVAVADGQSVTLGGIMQTRNQTVSSQVPLLGDIPMVGNAFKDKTNKIERTELLIIITPRVVRDDSEARSVTEEFRRQLNFGTGVPLIADPSDWRVKTERLLR